MRCLGPPESGSTDTESEGSPPITGVSVIWRGDLGVGGELAADLGGEFGDLVRDTREREVHDLEVSGRRAALLWMRRRFVCGNRGEAFRRRTRPGR